MNRSYVMQVRELGFQWDTDNPFLFCVHHQDFYPRGNEEMGPAVSLSGRNLGQDFTLKDGFRMYHGQHVPGFPEHPHRGFETITIVLEGFVDHSDSLGAAGRYGNGDVQWMTAGSGIQHAEMFPLIKPDRNNPLELFQIWLNLPKESKFVDPYYKMLWKEDIPRISINGPSARVTQVTVIAGELDGIKAVSPNPDSWAADENNHVAVWLIRMEAGASWELPADAVEAARRLYYYQGSGITVDGQEIVTHRSAGLKPGVPIRIENGETESRILFLQGRPIQEPVVQYGPFVMNTNAEIEQAYSDYRKTRFGGWPWSRPDHVHDRDRGRFARYTDGTEEIR